MGIDIEAVIGALTLEQKVALLAGHDAWHSEAVPGVPPMRCSDGPAGARGTEWDGVASASFPCGTALGATFDPGLVEEVGAALGREARSKGAHVLLAPTVNLHRTPIGGRNFECMSEDPELTAQIGVAYVRGLQSQGVAACIKHYVGNDTEFERMTISSEIDERTLREAYLLPFERAVSAGVRSIMSGYNKLNGTFMSQHDELLRGVLRDEWGFDGVVFSDWFGLHSTAEGLEAGLDLEMPGPPRHRGDKLVAAVRAGEVAEHRVDESVRRLLALFDWSGVGAIDSTERTDDSPATREVIRRTAVAATVLLKNDGGLLPFDTGDSVALIGPNSEYGQVQGGGSARVKPHRPIGPLAALRGRGITVEHAEGCSIDKLLPPLRGDFEVTFTAPDGTTATQPSHRMSYIWMTKVAEGISSETMSARVTGELTADRTGDWEFGMAAVGPAVLRVGGEVVIDLSQPQQGGHFFAQGSPEIRATAALEEGTTYDIELDYPYGGETMLRAVTVGAHRPMGGDPIGAAARAAARADVAVVVVGTNADWETEGEDRTTMDLPGEQDRLVAAVAAANPRTVVVINAGSPVTMPWLADVAAVLQVWFPGEEFGESLADVLLGEAEPGGRLPITVPKRLEDTPAFPFYPGKEGLAEYGERLFVGYRWYDDQGLEPQFHFGHGLGYTSFDIDDVAVSGDIDDGVTVQATVRNTGARDGREVVQVYVAPPGGDAGAPVRTLRGFAKVEVPAGGRRSVEVTLDRRAFSRWNVDAHSWEVAPGDHEVLVGRSSRDLRPAGTVTQR